MSRRKVRMVMMATAALVALAPNQAQARKSIWELMFPMSFKNTDEGDPGKSLQAPFAQTPAAQPGPVAGAAPLDKLYTENPAIAQEADLAIPHRSAAEIGAWLERGVSEILTFSPEDYNKHLEFLKTGLNESALADFKGFIEASKVVESLQANNMKLYSVVESTPMMLNEGVVNGRYRWLLEMPVTLSFLPRDFSGYGKKETINQHIIVTVQVGRVGRDKGIDQMTIESFKLKKNATRK